MLDEKMEINELRNQEKNFFSNKPNESNRQQIKVAQIFEIENNKNDQTNEKDQNSQKLDLQKDY